MTKHKANSENSGQASPHETKGELYVVATPLGNLGDITLRALEVLRRVDCIAAEDTRHARGLLQHHGIEAKLVSLHEHNEAQAASGVLARLRAGGNVALVSDAGTPCISDPGAKLVALAQAEGFKVVPLPGANAAIAALSASGLHAPHFLFHGFLPPKTAARCQVITGLKALPCALVFYEAPHRVVEAVADLAQCLEAQREIVIARELTKIFESIVRLPLGEAPAWLAADANRQRGEFVLIVSAPPPQSGLTAAAERTLRLLLAELPLKQAVKLAAEISGAPRNLLYERALELGEE